VLPKKIENWSLTSLQRLAKTGGRLVKHARYYWLLLAESHLTRWLFGGMVRRIGALEGPGGVGPGGLQTKTLAKRGGGDGKVCEGSPEQETVPRFWAYTKGRDGASGGRQAEKY